ncbi:protein ARK2N isoform 1-T2 [Pholidichthys leucotaenia]
MKMADSEKAEFVDAECPPECLDEAQSATASLQGEQQDEHLKTETTTSTSSPPREKEAESPVHTEGEQSLLSMPCLMKELRRDSAESQRASTGSDKPMARNIYESDSSNPCMLSPSSSGHLADSDTLSSGEEGAAPPAGGGEECNMEGTNEPGQATGKQTSASGGRKSRRSRSESEMPPNTMAAKKNRCQPTIVAAGSQEKQTNGKLAKVKGHRSQKHKERMRLLRQKREAAARKKYNLLQDSSTSDSELTCDSSTSSSEDEDDDTSGGSKTIKTDIPATSAKSRKRKPKMETTLEIFADKITSALKTDDSDLLLKMQAAQHERDLKMLSMLTQFIERSHHSPQPPFYQAAVQLSHLYNPREPPPLYPMASSQSQPFNETSNQPLSFLQDLAQPLCFNNAPPHPSNLIQPVRQAPANPQDPVQHASFSQAHPPSYHPPNDEENLK